MPALGAEITYLDGPVRSQLPLDVEQVLHRVRSAMVHRHGICYRRWSVGRRAATARDGIAIKQSGYTRIRIYGYATRDVAGKIKVRVTDFLIVEDTPSSTHHSLGIRRIGNAN